LALDQLLACAHGLKLQARLFHDPHHRTVRPCGAPGDLAHPRFRQQGLQHRLPGLAAVALPPVAPLPHHQANVGGAVPLVAIHRGGADWLLVLQVLDHEKAVAGSCETRQVGCATLGRVLVEALVAVAGHLWVVQPGQVALIDVCRLERLQAQAGGGEFHPMHSERVR